MRGDCRQLWRQRWERFIKYLLCGLKDENPYRHDVMTTAQAVVAGGLIAIIGLPCGPIRGTCHAGVGDVARIDLRARYQQQQDGDNSNGDRAAHGQSDYLTCFRVASIFSGAPAFPVSSCHQYIG